MAVIGELATLITARTEPFTKGLKTAQSQAATFGSRVRTSIGGGLGSISRMLRSTTGMLAGFGVALSATGLVTRAVKLASAAEDMRTAYATYLKDLQKADNLLAQLQKYSSATPFEASEIKEAGKQLLAFGFEAGNMMEYIRVIGDLAAGSQKPMADFVDILGKIRAGGVASMGDINRLADRGVPIFQELAKVMGVATSEVRKLVGTGVVGFDDVWKVMKNVTSETGLFGGAVDKMSRTMSGKLSTLKDNINQVMTDVGTAILEGLNIKELTERLTDLAQTYKQDIVDATTAGINMIVKAFEGLGAASDQFKMFREAWRMGWHGSMLKVTQALAWGRRNELTPELRENMLYHNQKYHEAQRRGIEARTSAESRIPLQPGQRGYMSPEQRRLMERQARTLEQIRAQQERENQLREQAYMRQYELYGGIVEYF